MFDRANEFFRFGAGRPPGTMWSIEKAYFELRRKHPGRDECAYLFLALRSRYLDKPEAAIHNAASKCRGLDEAIIVAVDIDFGNHVAVEMRDVLRNLPACSRCWRRHKQ